VVDRAIDAAMTARGGTAPVRVVLYFDVRPGREADFLDYLARLDAVGLIERHAGFLGGELCRATDGSSLVALVMLWTSRAAYRSWREGGPKLPSPSWPDQRLEEPAPGDVLEVVQVLRPPGGAEGSWWGGRV